MNARRKERRLLSWVPSIVLVVLMVAAGFVTVAINNSWWVDPNPVAGPDQTAPNGSSIFTGAGVDYLGRTGLVVIRLDSAALSAAELGLEPQGTRDVTAARPLRVQVVGADGALAVDEASLVTVYTEEGEVASVEVVQVPEGGFVGAQATLAEVAELYGWAPEEVATLSDRFAEANRAAGEAPASVTVGPGTAVGLAVTATLTVDGSAVLTYTAERLP